MTQRLLRAAFVLSLVGLVLLGDGPDASARLDPKEWKQAQVDAVRLFGRVGQREEKAGLIDRLVQDGERRSWKLLVEALVKEAEVWVRAATKAAEMEAQIEEVQGKPMAKRSGSEQRQLEKWKEEFTTLEATTLEQRGVVDDVTTAVAQGPKVLRRSLFARARSNAQWAVRVAAAEVAAVNPAEKDSFEHLSKAMARDPDPRVRMAGLEALRKHLGEQVTSEPDPAAEPDPPNGKEDGDEDDSPDILSTAESLVLGRLADQDWGVQLGAIRLVEQNKLTKAIPHLITALNFASPRVAQAIGVVLRDFTGENFDPYAEPWAQWWEDNKASYDSKERVRAGKNPRPPSDAHLYGIPIHSDRILFIIDTSDSMKDPTKNENPAENWKPKGPVTGPGGPPPPPPPEEILSGPKIEVAKHELKKAIQRLPKTAMFNIVEFNTGVYPWRDVMQEASEKVRKEALAYVRSLQPKGITYVEGALRLGFKMAGLGAVDSKYPEVNIDTMLLICDGAPTDADVRDPKLVPFEPILEKVRGWNSQKRVVINCIGVDMQADSEFLRRLAEEHGGEYVDR